MQLRLIRANVEVQVTEEPTACPQCGSRHVGHWQTVRKPVRDTVYQEVTGERYYCRAGKATFRVYPIGVSGDDSRAWR